MRLIITGGAGFIGSALIRFLLQETDYKILNIDDLTYAGSTETLKQFEENNNHNFEKINICDLKSLKSIFEQFKPEGIIHLAAETHVDRSIDNPISFIETNIIGTYNLLECSRLYLENLSQNNFRFHHVSTDEVYGDIYNKPSSTEMDPYKPSSPYSASKASADHLVRAWHRTYDLPVVITNCSNNYGPYQFPEKLIPLMIINAIEQKPLPVYGDGNQIRNWIYVKDHVEALMNVFHNGQTGETYNIGSRIEITNIEIVNLICDLLNKLRPDPGTNYHDLITYVTDRPGHDKKYSINSEKIEKELGWLAKTTIEQGLEETINWYLNNKEWYKSVLDNNYNLQRLGLTKTL